jgi:hypothetical protein
MSAPRSVPTPAASIVLELLKALLASTSRAFSNGTGLHIPCNKIAHLELMLPKEHDFNQGQNYGHGIY